MNWVRDNRLLFLFAAVVLTTLGAVGLGIVGVVATVGALLGGGALRDEPGDVGIRIEAIARVPEAAADVVAEVVETEYLGARTQVLLHHPRAEGLALLLEGRVAVAPGARLGLRLPEEHRVRFDAAPGPEHGPAPASAGPRDGRPADFVPSATREDRP